MLKKVPANELLHVNTWKLLRELSVDTLSTPDPKQPMKKFAIVKWTLGLAFAGVLSGITAPANATVMTVDYTATSGAGTPITIGGNASPQYSFVLGTFFNGAAQYKIQGNSGALVSFPDNGVPQFKLAAVTTRLEGITFTDGNYQLFFDIGATAYTGLATVTNSGREITSISYDPVAPVTAVPESPTWAMMLFGFLGLGFLTFRHRRRGIISA
jgi:hypothetical protein